MLESIFILSLIFENPIFALYAKYISLSTKKLDLKIRHINNFVIKKQIEAILDKKIITRHDVLFTANFDL